MNLHGRRSEVLQRARDAWRRGIFAGDLDAVRASLAELQGLPKRNGEVSLLQGHLLHAEYINTGTATIEELRVFRAARDLAGANGDRLGVANAAFGEALYHQVLAEAEVLARDAGALNVLEWIAAARGGAR